MSLSTGSEQYYSVTWFGSRIAQPDLFYEKPKPLMPKGTLVDGAQVEARMQDGTARYQAVDVFDQPKIFAGHERTREMLTMTLQLRCETTKRPVKTCMSFATNMILVQSPEEAKSWTVVTWI